MKINTCLAVASRRLCFLLRRILEHNFIYLKRLIERQLTSKSNCGDIRIKDWSFMNILHPSMLSAQNEAYRWVLD